MALLSSHPRVTDMLHAPDCLMNLVINLELRGDVLTKKGTIGSRHDIDSN